jgi:hypothetical protein
MRSESNVRLPFRSRIRFPEDPYQGSFIFALRACIKDSGRFMTETLKTTWIRKGARICAFRRLAYALFSSISDGGPTEPLGLILTSTED